MIFSPKPYQGAASAFLQERFEAALFSGTGLGKTGTTLHAASNLLLDGAARAFLVVAPLRVCNITWPNEVAKWENFSWMPVANLRTREGQEMLRRKSACIYLCNYEMLPKVAEYKNPPWDYVIFDELTRAKNHGSARINSFRRAAAALRGRWGLTGTPTPNSHLELFAQIRLLDGGKRLGRAFAAFQQAYFTSDYMGYNWTPRAGAIESITGRIADMTLVQRTSDYLEAPDIISEDIEVALPQGARAKYNEMEREALLQLKEDKITAINAAVAVNKLLQMASGEVYDDEGKVHTIHSAKIEALAALRKKHPAETLLIFCNYKHEQERIAKAIGATVFSAGLSAKRQDDLVRMWNARAISALVADPRSIGHGLNLQEGGRTVVWYSRGHSRELYDQANARLYRTGQKEQVRVLHINASRTVDDAVAETLRDREESQKTLLKILHNLNALQQ